MPTHLRIQIVPLKEVPINGPAPTKDQQPPVALVVDDERVIADTLSVILRQNGFGAMAAYDGEQALALAREQKPDLLLSDVMMGPGIDGTELAMEIVREHPECKVLLFSGHSATQELLAKSYEAGHHFTLLSKPLHPADLLERLRRTFSDFAAA